MLIDIDFFGEDEILATRTKIANQRALLTICEYFVVFVDLFSFWSPQMGCKV